MQTVSTAPSILVRGIGVPSDMPSMEARHEEIRLGLLTFVGEKASPNHVWSVKILGPADWLNRGYVLASFTLGDDEWQSLVALADVPS